MRRVCNPLDLESHNISLCVCVQVRIWMGGRGGVRVSAGVLETRLRLSLGLDC